MMNISHCLRKVHVIYLSQKTPACSINVRLILSICIDVLTRIVDYSKEVLLSSFQQFHFVIQWVWSFIFLLPFQQEHTLRYIYLF